MKKRSSIIKFSIVGVILVIGLVLSFVAIPFGTSNFKSFAGTIKLGLDLKGGIYARYQVEGDGNITGSDGKTTDFNSAMNGTRKRIEDMLVNKGYGEATVVIEGTDRLRVEVPDVDNPEQLFDLIGKPATLEFQNDAGHTILEGKNIVDAYANYDNQSGSHAVYLNLDKDGTAKFAEATSEAHHGESISILISVPGEDKRVISKPTINTTITNGKALITGMGSPEAAQNLVDQIKSGQFELELTIIETSTVSATLGENALRLGLIAGAIGVLLIIVFMCVLYRLNGVLASGALLCYIVLFLFFLGALPWVQLTLPGIAGVLLSIGMEIDGNVIMFERIKNEFRNGKSIKASSFAGMKKSFATIFDSNVTTIIAAIILMIFGTGIIKSFALTLLVGVALAMFTNLVVINFFLKWSLGLNQSNAKLYGLKRGAGYEHLAGDKTDVTIAESEELSESEKAKAKSRKERRAAAEGGIV